MIARSNRARSCYASLHRRRGLCCVRPDQTRCGSREFENLIPVQVGRASQVFSVVVADASHASGAAKVEIGDESPSSLSNFPPRRHQQCADLLQGSAVKSCAVNQEMVVQRRKHPGSSAVFRVALPAQPYLLAVCPSAAIELLKGLVAELLDCITSKANVFCCAALTRRRARLWRGSALKR